MAPDVKIRNLDQATYDRLKARADEERSSMESLLRTIVSEAVGGCGVAAAEWERAGFEEVREIVPHRDYELVAGTRRFRIRITRAVTMSPFEWNSTIDEMIEISVAVEASMQRVSVWTSPLGIADRHLGDSAEMALRDAMHWLADYAGVDPISRARHLRDVEATLHPGMYLVVDSLRSRLGPADSISWRGTDVACVSMGDLIFVLSRLVDTIVMKTSVLSTGARASEENFLMSTDVASHIAESMDRLVQAHKDRSEALTKRDSPRGK